MANSQIGSEDTGRIFIVETNKPGLLSDHVEKQYVKVNGVHESGCLKVTAHFPAARPVDGFIMRWHLPLLVGSEGSVDLVEDPSKPEGSRCGFVGWNSAISGIIDITEELDQHPGCKFKKETSVEISARSVGRVFQLRLAHTIVVYLAVLRDSNGCLMVVAHRAHERACVDRGYLRAKNLPVKVGDLLAIFEHEQCGGCKSGYYNLEIMDITDVTDDLASHPLCLLGRPGTEIGPSSVGRVFAIFSSHYRNEVTFLGVDGVTEKGSLIVSAHGSGGIYNGFIMRHHLPIHEGGTHDGVYSSTDSVSASRTGGCTLIYRITDITDNPQSYGCRLAPLTPEG